MLLEKEVVERPQMQAIVKSADGDGVEDAETFADPDRPRIAADRKA
jgi:hypothetical protein